MTERIFADGPTEAVPTALKEQYVLAGYQDEAGYQVHITDGVPEAERYCMGVERRGRMYITSPEGETVPHGYWLGQREKEWGISDSVWATMTPEERAAPEVKQQATRYEPLSEQFKRQRLTHGVLR